MYQTHSSISTIEEKRKIKLKRLTNLIKTKLRNLDILNELDIQSLNEFELEELLDLLNGIDSNAK